MNGEPTGISIQGETKSIIVGTIPSDEVRDGKLMIALDILTKSPAFKYASNLDEKLYDDLIKRRIQYSE